MTRQGCSGFGSLSALQDVKWCNHAINVRKIFYLIATIVDERKKARTDSWARGGPVSTGNKTASPRHASCF